MDTGIAPPPADDSIESRNGRLARLEAAPLRLIVALRTESVPDFTICFLKLTADESLLFPNIQFESSEFFDSRRCRIDSFLGGCLTNLDLAALTMSTNSMGSLSMH